MRLVGIVLVILGALPLGWYGFNSSTGAANPGGGSSVTAGKPGAMPPLVGGIAVATGLLILTTNGRRD